MDLHGPYPEQSFGGHRYAAVFVDSFSGYVHVVPIRHKSEALLALTDFMQKVGTPKQLNADWGTEFMGGFSRYCRQAGIRVRRSEPYTPWRNGQVERFNRTLKTMSRSMLVHAGLPLRFWARSLLTAAHTLNRLPSQRTRGDIVTNLSPYEYLHGRPPSLDHLRVFGSLCYPHIPKPLQSGATVISAHPHVFVGYDEYSSD